MDKSRLAKLPPELRLIVYEFASPFMAESIPFEEVHDRHAALLRTCKEISKEAKPFFQSDKITSISLQVNLHDGARILEDTVEHMCRLVRNERLPNLDIVICSLVGDDVGPDGLIFPRLDEKQKKSRHALNAHRQALQERCMLLRNHNVLLKSLLSLKKLKEVTVKWA